MRGRIRDNGSPDHSSDIDRCCSLASGLRVGCCPPVVRRGEPVCPGREAGRRASAAGPGMAHRRVPLDKGVNRGNPTQEGEQVGVAFLLVTFLWPRKEKSLAQARRAGETPSRTASSRPAWQSHAQSCWRPLTLTLSRKGRGDQTEVAEAGGRNSVEGIVTSCPARRSRAIETWGGIRQAMPLPTPDPLPQGERRLLPRTITLR
jgi:hypothetical protein